jgi:uncharacterized DUF497 family protein
LDFEWDEHNENHVLGHGVEPDEAEEGLLDPERVGVPAHNPEGERRWAVLGTTEEGRLLFVVFTHREGRVRVVIARDASRREKRSYRKRRRSNQ